MNSGHVGLARLAAGDHGLVGQNHEQKARFSQ